MMLLRVFIPAMCGLALLLSGCGIFKNAVRNTQRATHIDRSQRSTMDTQSYEQLRLVDTIVRLAADSSSLLTSLAQLQLQPVMLSTANGIRIRLNYDSATGHIRADAATEARLVPVKLQEHTRQSAASRAELHADVHDSQQAKQVTRTSNVNWNLVIIATACAVTLGILLYLFISKKTSLL